MGGLWVNFREISYIFLETKRKYERQKHTCHLGLSFGTSLCTTGRPNSEIHGFSVEKMRLNIPILAAFYGLLIIITIFLTLRIADMSYTLNASKEENAQ